MKRTFLLLLLVYLAALAILFSAHLVRVDRDPGLNGEELAVAYRNVYLLPQHIQSDCYATTFSSTLYYWVGSYLIPITINSQRIFKIIGMAFLPVLIFLIIKQIRPGTSTAAALAVSLMTIMAPVLSWFSIMAIEVPTDMLFSLLAFLLALRFSWKNGMKKLWLDLGLIGLLIVWFVHYYAGSMVFALVIPLLLAWKAIEEGESGKLLNLAIAAAVVYLLIWWPKLYFGGNVVFFGGGRNLDLSWNSIWNNLTTIYEDIGGTPQSYLVGNEVGLSVFPWLWYKFLFTILFVAGAIGLLREKNKAGFWLLLIMAVNLLFGVFSSTMPGIRRVIPCLVILFMAAGFGLDRLEMIPRGKALRAILVVVLLATAGFGFCSNYLFVAANYRPWLQREFTYLPLQNYEETVESLIKMSQAGPVRFRRQLEVGFNKKSGLDEFIASHRFEERCNSGKYEYDGQNRLILRGQMSEAEKMELYALYPDQASRRVIDGLFDRSQGYLFHNLDTVHLLRLFCQRRGLSDRNIIWVD